MPFLTFCHLTDFLLKVLVTHNATLRVSDLSLKVLQFFPDAAGCLLFGLAFPDFSDCVLYSAVGFFHQLIGLLLSFPQYSFAASLNVIKVCLVTADGALDVFFPLMDGLAFVLPITLVADDILKILVTLDIVGSDDFGGIGDNLFWQPDLSGNFNGKGRAGLPDSQLEKRLHLMAVVKHGAIDHFFVVFGKMFQVLVVSGDDSKRFFLPELPKHRLCYSTSDSRLCACSEFINEQKRLMIGIAHHLLHVHQVRGISGKVIFYALFITDIYHQVAEDASL